MDQEQQDNETEAASRAGMELLQPTPHGEIRSRANTMYPLLKRSATPKCAILAVDCLSLLKEVGAAAIAETEFKCRIIELEEENVRLCIKLEKASATIAALRAEREPSEQRTTQVRDGVDVYNGMDDA